jgi:PadR family transcriptional regulator, regulatory protein PadR
MARRNATFSAGVSQLLLLRLLAQREMYGYELGKSIRAVTRQEIRLGEGVLYPLLHGLEVQGLLRSRRASVAGRPRVYYRVTTRGKRRLAFLLEQWHRASSAVNSALGDESYA